jgi:hypothetical protein
MLNVYRIRPAGARRCARRAIATAGFAGRETALLSESLSRIR